MRNVIESSEDPVLMFCQKMIEKYSELAHLRESSLPSVESLHAVRDFLLEWAHSDYNNNGQRFTPDYYELCELEDRKSRAKIARDKFVSDVFDMIGN